eukprot:CAMPEP_0180140774 /NCGR_PEP_ID=MMETSP0986-20121125/14456_1 /TAXON_ID=697907 /ORGANISM="non described non described, Strain CCMP2293" /LENGTH=59 /DNA_ID=CAMNT_0022083387 /DNA_START=23 /DNA_END=202 /DNA_ORIENTATION=-
MFHILSQLLTSARTEQLYSDNTVPAVADCGLFGTTCDGNTYIQPAQATMRTPASFHLSP